MGKEHLGRGCALIAGAVLVLCTIANIAANTAKAQALEPNGDPDAASVDVAVVANAPLTALSVTSGSLNCSQGRIVIGKNGKVGFLAPVVGPNVLRGSLDSGSAISWAVISLDGLAPEVLNAVTTCLAAR